MRAKTLLALCVVGGLSMVRANVASALTTDMNLQFSGVANPISADYLLLFSNQGGGQTFEGYAPLAAIPAGSSSQAVVLGPSTSSQTVPAGIEGATPIDAVALIGVYTSSDAQGITLGVSSAAASLGQGETYTTLTQSLTTMFPTESQLITALQNPSQSEFSMILSEIGTPVGANASEALITTGSEGELLSFSNGTISGTVGATISTPTGPTVPLPAAGWMAAVTMGMIGGVSALRRWRAARA